MLPKRGRNSLIYAQLSALAWVPSPACVEPYLNSATSPGQQGCSKENSTIGRRSRQIYRDCYWSLTGLPERPCDWWIPRIRIPWIVHDQSYPCDLYFGWSVPSLSALSFLSRCWRFLEAVYRLRSAQCFARTTWNYRTLKHHMEGGREIALFCFLSGKGGKTCFGKVSDFFMHSTGRKEIFSPWLLMKTGWKDTGSISYHKGGICMNFKPVSNVANGKNYYFV